MWCLSVLVYLGYHNKVVYTKWLVKNRNLIMEAEESKINEKTMLESATCFLIAGSLLLAMSLHGGKASIYQYNVEYSNVCTMYQNI